MVEASPDAPRAHPLSPHLQIWRWHVTMAASILHRATGVALFGGAILFAGWAVALASGAGAFHAYRDALAWPPMRLVLFAITVSLFFHMANGVRHLFWDFGKGFAKRTADATAWIAFAFALVASAAVWAFALMSGAG